MKNFFLLIVSVGLLLSCSKEENPKNENTKKQEYSQEQAAAVLNRIVSTMAICNSLMTDLEAMKVKIDNDPRRYSSPREEDEYKKLPELYLKYRIEYLKVCK